ncbi:hypothetical protein ACLMJK_000082 [Lecanora helva]
MSPLKALFDPRKMQYMYTHISFLVISLWELSVEFLEAQGGQYRRQWEEMYKKRARPYMARSALMIGLRYMECILVQYVIGPAKVRLRSTTSYLDVLSMRLLQGAHGGSLGMAGYMATIVLVFQFPTGAAAYGSNRDSVGAVSNVWPSGIALFGLLTAMTSFALCLRKEVRRILQQVWNPMSLALISSNILVILATALVDDDLFSPIDFATGL